MTSPIALRLSLCASCLALALAGSGCADRGPPPRIVDGVAYGTTSVPFRARWWHFYERALSWSAGGFDREAEADLRECLALRQTDSRRARTYGMHFVQCFAHRELGALLLKRGAIDEARDELRRSMRQEPSAKAEYLLGRIAALHGGQAPAAPPAENPPAIAAAPIERADADPPHANLTIDAVAAAGAEEAAPEAPRSVWVSGSVSGDEDAGLWYRRPAGGAAVRIPLDPDGRFHALVPVDADYALGTRAAPATDASLPATGGDDLAREPRLTIDGGATERVLYGPRLWLRYQAEAADGLRSLTVVDDERGELCRLALHGLRAAGTFPLELATGERRLRFSIEDQLGAQRTSERVVTVRDPPSQQRGLRATALDLPLQTPRAIAMRPADDGCLLAAMVRDGRFRFVDRRADDVLAKELQLVEAGYVDQTTAARAGARLDCRYVVAGTLTRGAGDMECFLRLIHCASGRVVATSDAYAEALDPARESDFYAAAAARLRQAFPVIEGHETRAGGDVTLDVGETAGVVELMRFHVLGDDPGGSPVPVATIEVRRRTGTVSHARVISGNPPETARAISE